MKRFVIIEKKFKKNGDRIDFRDQFETILPEETTLEDAKFETRRSFERLTSSEKEKTCIELASLECVSDDELAEDALNSYNPIVWGNK